MASFCMRPEDFAMAISLEPWIRFGFYSLVAVFL